MKLIDRYILKELLIYLFAALLILTLVFVVGEFLKGESDASPGQLIYYVALNIPQVIAQMMAPAVMIATMTTLTMLNRKNELAAIQAGGVGINHISALVLIIAFFISCINLFMNDRIVPPLAHKRQLYYWRDIKGRKDFSLDIKSSKVWYRNRNHIFNLQTFNPSTNQIQGFGLYVFDDAFQLQEHVSAAHAYFETGENGEKGTWKLSNGMITIFPKRDLFPLSKHFDAKELKLEVTPHDFKEIDKHVESLRLK